MRARRMAGLAAALMILVSVPAMAQSPGPSTAPEASSAPSPSTGPEQTTTPSPTTAPAAGSVVSSGPCADDMAEGFRCVTLAMPLDHTTDTGRTIPITFAIQRHTGSGPARGTFVTLTGGPGSSGIQSAVSYTDAFAPAIRRLYDIVFLDQRGAHLSGDFTCPNAALAWYRTDADPAVSTATTGLGADAQRFVDDCIAESGVDTSILPYLGTAQAVEDLEAIREYLGEDRLMLYGESYGTQFAQQYAAAHPDRLDGLLLDGPVDLSLELFDYYSEQVKGFEQALEGTLYDCTVAKACTTDVPSPNALIAWDDVADPLADRPVEYEFHAADGTTQMRRFTAGDLVTATSAFLYSQYDRMLLQRALAAASQGDPWYLTRLFTSGLVMDPETETAILDTSYSDGLYYAVECLDYALPGDTPEARADAYLEAGRERGMDRYRMGDIFYGDLPCAFWPAQPTTTERPALLTDVPYPVFVLGATLDPATPWGNGERIAAALGDRARTLLMPGGPHVIFGRGNACPDDQVTRFLVRGAIPAAARTVCRGDVADAYVPLPPLSADAIRSTTDALRAVDREIVTSVDYWYWSADEPLAAGCRFGGTIRYTPTDDGSRVRMDGCSWSRGLAFTGSATIDDDTGGITMRLREAGTDGPTGDVLRYTRDGDDLVTVRGSLERFPDEVQPTERPDDHAIDDDITIDEGEQVDVDTQ